MSYLGSWKIDDALTFACNTHDASDGSATDADSVPSYRVYEDETGTAILTGSMAKLDDANTTGFYSEQITLSAANGLEKGKCYTIYISATVSSTTGTMNHTFQIEAEVDANVVSASNVSANVEQISGDSTAADNAESFFDGTGYAGTNNTIPTVTSVTNQVTADVTAISGDSTAANNLEAMFDDTGFNASNSTIGTCTTNTDMRGTDSALLAASAPTNFGDLAITVTTGRVDVASIEGSDATDQIRDAVVDDATRIDASALNTLSGHDPGATIAAQTDVTGLNDLSAADVNAEVVDVIRTDTIPDSYSTDGSQPTVAQAILAIQQFLMEKSVSGTTVTVKKPDGSTSAMTFTLDDGTSPTSITRAT